MAPPRRPRTRLFLALWLSGLPGIVAVTGSVIPALVADRSLPVPLWVVQGASGLQSAALLAAATLAGVALAPRVGLAAPAFEAWATGGSPVARLRPKWGPAIAGGVAGALLLALMSSWAPPPLVEAGARFRPSAAVRLLYGGITEEVLCRWGLTTVVLWLLWQVSPRRPAPPSTALAATAIVASALAFGALHLPAASALTGGLSTPTVAYVLGANGCFGVIAGVLYVRHGLEAAMLAHMLAHALSLATGA